MIYSSSAISQNIDDYVDNAGDDWKQILDNVQAKVVKKITDDLKDNFFDATNKRITEFFTRNS